jgi:hypothetical protein
MQKMYSMYWLRLSEMCHSQFIHFLWKEKWES